MNLRVEDEGYPQGFADATPLDLHGSIFGALHVGHNSNFGYADFGKSEFVDPKEDFQDGEATVFVRRPAHHLRNFYRPFYASHPLPAPYSRRGL